MKRKQWTKPHHKLVRNIACALLSPYIKCKYGISVEKFREKEKRPYLILYNHQTSFDQFFVGMAFSGAVYYMATEDIFSNGLTSVLLRALVAPIPIQKQTRDIRAILSCIQVAKEGGTIAIAPEGNRTYSGKTEHMEASIAFLAKKLGMPIALFRIEGGYGIQPRWSDKVRKGRMRAYVSRVIEPEEYADMPAGELFQEIRAGLAVNEANADAVFLHKKRAEYIERVLFVCPFCGLSEFESRDARFRCKRCAREICYEPSTELRGVGFTLPFRFVNDWYAYQKEFISEMDLSAFADTPLYCDEVSVSEVIPWKRKRLLQKHTRIRLYTDRITVEGDAVPSLPFSELRAIAVLGRNKLDLYHGKTVYQIKGGKRFNALKYVLFFYHHKNIVLEDNHGKFWGL